MQVPWASSLLVLNNISPSYFMEFSSFMFSGSLTTAAAVGATENFRAPAMRGADFRYLISTGFETLCQ